MKFRSHAPVMLSALLTVAPVAGAASVSSSARQQTQQQQQASRADASPAQRLEVMRSQLEGLRRSLNSAVAAFNASGDKTEKTNEQGTSSGGDDARARLRGLEREVGSLLSDVNNLRGRQERAERYDAAELDKLEAAVADLNKRAEDGLRSTAAERRTNATATAAPNTKKKKGGFLSKLNPFGGDEEKSKYAELTGTVAPGRDRELFELAAQRTRKGNFEEGRLLFNTIVLTYTDSPFLPLSKLAIADSFYLEGTSSALIQANASYREWLQFFPTHVLADDVMLKMAEAEMRQMGLADRDTSHARKAEQQLKVVMQQFPETPLKDDVQVRLKEVQENLAMHNLQVANFYLARYQQGKAANPRGAQNRLNEIARLYPNFSYMDEVLYNLGMTYVTEEEPDEAAKYFTRLLRDHPNSRFAEKAGEQLDLIGIARPTPDPEALKRPDPVRPGLTEKFFSEVFGRVPVTVTKDGVIISKKNDGTDLIDEAIARGGELQSDRTPTAPVYRRAPARPIAPPVNQTPNRAPVGQTGADSTTSSATTAGGVSVQPTRAGAPPGASNVPAQQQPPAVTETPATGAPTSGVPSTTSAPANGTKPPSSSNE